MCGGIGVCPSQRVHGPSRADSETVTVTATEEVVVVVEVQPPRDGDSHNHFEADAKPHPEILEYACRSSLALTALGKRPAKGRAPRTGYDRAKFGQAWSDDVTETYGHNGCDTRIICTP